MDSPTAARKRHRTQGPRSAARSRDGHARVAGFAHGRVPAPVRAEQLLDVAERLFAARGYGPTSIEAVARAAQVTRPVVYEHFGSKDGLYLACLRRARGQLETMMFAAVATTADLRGQLERGADAYFRFLETDPARWRVLFGGGAAVSGEVAEEAMRLHLATEQRFADLLRAAVPDQDERRLQAFAHAIGGAAHQLAQWWLRTPGVTREQVVEWYCAATWEGLVGLVGPTARRPPSPTPPAPAPPPRPPGRSSPRGGGAPARRAGRHPRRAGPR
jgi:AcrR family transcriptional regulator